MGPSSTSDTANPALILSVLMWKARACPGPGEMSGQQGEGVQETGQGQPLHWNALGRSTLRDQLTCIGATSTPRDTRIPTHSSSVHNTFIVHPS